MSSGIIPDPSCVTTYNELKFGKKYSFIIYKIKDKKTIEVDYKAEPNLTVSDEGGFIEYATMQLEKEPFFAVVDFKRKASEPGTIFMISCISEGAKVSDKIVHASSESAFKEHFDGISGTIGVNSIADLDEERLASYLKKH